MEGAIVIQVKYTTARVSDCCLSFTIDVVKNCGNERERFAWCRLHHRKWSLIPEMVFSPQRLVLPAAHW